MSDKLIQVLKQSVADAETAISMATSAGDFHYKAGMYSSVTFIYLVYVENYSPEIAETAVFSVVEKFKRKMFTQIKQ